MTNDYLKMQVETMLFKCDKCGTMTTQKNNPIAVTGYETYCNKCKQFMDIVEWDDFTKIEIACNIQKHLNASAVYLLQLPTKPKQEDIKEFRGPTRWLSNFAACEITLDGIIYPTTEHAYMSAKNNEKEWKIICSTTEKPGHIKKLGMEVKLRDDWEDVKISIMSECIDQKFNQEPYHTMLLQTDNAHLSEGNLYGDLYWGIDLNTGKGDNLLGKLIMNKRAQLRINSVKFIDESSIYKINQTI